MTKEGKTIDGLSVRSAKDSKLVTRSKAERIVQAKAPVKAKKSSVVKVNSARARAVAKHVAVASATASTRKAPKRPAATASSSVTAKASQSVKVAARRSTKRPVVKKPVNVAANTPAANTAPRVKVVARRRVAKPIRPVKPIGAEINNANESIRMTEQERAEKIQEAHEEFLAPVESFNFSETEDSRETTEGRVEEVEDEEVIDMKKSKKELRAAEKRAKKERKALKKQQKSRKKAVVIALVILAVILLSGGVVFYFWGNDILKRITGGEGDIWSAIGTFVSETYEPLKADENGRTNVLVFGTSGYNMSGESYGGYEHDGSQLTDSIMVISLDQETGDIAMVSLPRDLYAAPTCTATGKVNEVYWCALEAGNDETGAAQALQAKVQQVLGLETQYFVHINWGALVSIVDTLGGVTVTLDEDINDWGWTNAVFQAGVPTTVNGEEALGLARARHGTTNGDFTRGNSQQKLLIAIKDKVVEKGLGVTDAIGILSALGDNLRTNMNMSEMKTSAHLLEQFDLENMRQIPLVDENNSYMTTSSINGISYVVPLGGASNYIALQEYVQEMLISDPIEREGAKIEVLNGKDEVGVASEERTKLEAEGFKITEIGDAPERDWVGVTIYDTSDGIKPETKVALEKYYSVEMKEMNELPAEISPLGVDFIVVIGQ